MSALPFVYLIMGLLGVSLAVLAVAAVLDSRPEADELVRPESSTPFLSQLLGYRQRRRSQRPARGAAQQSRLA